jgi:hypothetical protein
MKRNWQPLPAEKLSDDRFEVSFPAEAAEGVDWFVVASDDRPVTVSSEFMHIGKPIRTPEHSTP